MSKKNNIKKSFKPAYIVDITWCNDSYDTALAFAYEKQRAGQPLSNDNIDTICFATVDAFGDILNEAGLISKVKGYIAPAGETICICEKPKKDNIFKRFWKRLKYAFTW